MWAELKHPRHVDFYRELHDARYELQEDWMPMVRAVQYFQEQDYAQDLHAFTSLIHFQITTAPSYSEQKGHACVGITWNFRNRLFGLGFWEFDTASVATQKDIIQCNEEELPSAVNSLILRLSLNARE